MEHYFLHQTLVFGQASQIGLVLCLAFLTLSSIYFDIFLERTSIDGLSLSKSANQILVYGCPEYSSTFKKSINTYKSSMESSTL